MNVRCAVDDRPGNHETKSGISHELWFTKYTDASKHFQLFIRTLFYKQQPELEKNEAF